MLCNSDESGDVAEGVVSMGVFQLVGASKERKLVGGSPLFVYGPHETVWAQGTRHAHSIKQIPARAVFGPSPLIGIVEVAIMQETDKRIVEADAVEAGSDSAGREDLLLKDTHELCFSDAFTLGFLRCNAGNQDGVGAGQYFVGEFYQYIHRLPYWFELESGALTGKLHDAVAFGVEAGSLEIVEEEGLNVGHEVSLALRIFNKHFN